jgi:hypothetical protein
MQTVFDSSVKPGAFVVPRKKKEKERMLVYNNRKCDRGPSLLVAIISQKDRKQLMRYVRCSGGGRQWFWAPSSIMQRRKVEKPKTSSIYQINSLKTTSP